MVKNQVRLYKFPNAKPGLSVVAKVIDPADPDNVISVAQGNQDFIETWLDANYPDHEIIEEDSGS